MAESGVHSVAYAFPNVAIVTTSVDKELDEQFHIMPGIGESCQLFFQLSSFEIITSLMLFVQSKIS